MRSGLRYSKVYRHTWDDGAFQRLTAAGPNGQTLWLRLLSGPELGVIPGLIRTGEAALAEAIRWPLKGFREAFTEVIREGLAKADWEARLIWLPKSIEYNPPQSVNVVKSWAKEWELVPDCQLKAEAYSILKAYTLGLAEGYRHAFAHGIRNPYLKACRIQEQEQEHKQEEEIRPISDDASSSTRLRAVKPANETTDGVREVFEFWLAMRREALPGSRRADLTPVRKRKIQTRLAESYSVDDLKLAVEGMLCTAFNIEGGHTDIELCCRDAVHVDRYMEQGRKVRAIRNQVAS